MSPYSYFPIHPALKNYVSIIGVMRINFAASGLSPFYHFPWMNNTHLFFPLCDEPLRVKSTGDREYRSHKEAYFVGPKLVNDVVDFGRERHVLGITFRPGVFQQLMHIPGREVTNLDIDARSIFGADLQETELRLREAKNDEELLAITEQFLLRRLKSVAGLTPFDQAMNELLLHKGNMSMDVFAGYACKSVRQLERMCMERLGMPPRLFARLTRFGHVLAAKEMHPALNWTTIAHQLGYFDQMHLIKDFKAFMGSTPRTLDLAATDSNRMMAALHGLG